jgi:DNA-binding beta-propeller fold protein YncE
VSRPRWIVAAATALLVGATAAGYALSDDGEIGPARHETANGRVLHPAGVMTQVGNFPTGGALTPNGRFYWSVSTGRGYNDVRIVDVRTNRLVQTLPIPGASGGIVMNRRKPVVYVSGVRDSREPSEMRNKSLPGRHGDLVHVFRYSRHTGRAHYLRKFKVPPPTGSPVPQQYPPNPQAKPKGWPDRLAYSAETRRLLVPLNLADRAVIVDTRTHKKTYAVVGHYPYGAAIVRHGTVGLVSNEADGTVSVIDLGNGLVTTTIRVGPALSHPESITVDPSSGLAYVTMANTDHVAVISLRTMKTVVDFSLQRPQGLGVSPVAAALDRRQHRLYVAEEGADDIAVLNIRRTTPRLVGRIPTAAFPADVAVGHGRVVWLSAKGFGFGPNLNGPQPYTSHDGSIDIDHVTYLPSAIRGDVGVLATPGRTALAHLTPVAARQMIPVDRTQPPAHTPLRPDGPIKHVFFIVKENRTYDQVLGDDPRGDGDRHLELFGPGVTPNLHALVRRFPLLDHAYADSEASVDGHYWMSAATVPDYVQKNWMQFYAARGRPNDFGFYAVTWPGNGFLFDQAMRQNITFFNYGEALAGELPLPDKDRTAALTKSMVAKLAHSDLGIATSTGVGPQAGGHCYPSDSGITHDFKSLAHSFDASRPPGTRLTNTSRFDCFHAHFTQQLATNSVPAFNYLVLPNDHTVGTTPGQRTPQAMMADNDYGLGQVVDLISHSSIWKSSAIFVVEDDSQNGSDHVDAHRVPAEVISPYTRQGAVIHHRYDFLSVVRSMELILGMEPLGLNDAVAEPMYGVFTTKPGNAASYTAIAPQQNRMQVNLRFAPDAALSASLDFSSLDQVPQRLLDRILWHAVHGEDSTPPPPGPNAADSSQDP